MKNFKMFIVIVLFLPISMLDPLVFADLAADLTTADELIATSQYIQAEQIYLNAINQADPNKPDELELAFNARKKLSVVYLASDRQSDAQGVIQQLFEKHSNHERLPHAVHEIIEQSKELNKTLEAGQIYQNILSAQAKHPEVIWLKMGVAIANAHLNDDLAVDSTLQNIIAEHATDERAVEAFGQIAWTYRKLKKHDKARQVYQYVLDNWSNKDRAIFSQRGIILCNLALKDQAAADTATQELLQKFAGDKNIALVTWYLANEYKNRKDWARTRPLCEYILKNHPGDENAISAKQALIFASIDQKDAIMVQTGLQELFAKFSSDKKLPSIAYGTAGKLSRYNDAAAQQLYQYIINQHPNHDYVPHAKVKLGHIKFRAGDDNAAENIFATLLTQYKNHPILPKVIMLIADGYWERALLEPKKDRKINQHAKRYFQKAITKSETVITNFPQIPHITAEAHHFTGECYYQLGQYDKAIEYCQKVIDNWPDYAYAWKAQFRIVKTNKRLLEAGVISESDAEAKITASCESLVEKFPECPAVRAAHTWLKYYHAK